MRIAYINNFYNPGGSTKTAYALASIISASNEMQFYGFWDGSFREKFDKIGEAHLLPSSNFDYGNELLSRLEKFDPDIIHVFIPGGQNPSYFNKLTPRSKKFATILCEQPIGFNTNLFDRIFFQSNYGENYSGKLNNGFVVRPGYEYEFEPTRQRDVPVLGRVSAFCPSKLVDHTVGAASIFKNNKFIVAGEIQDKNYYSHISNIQRQNNISNLSIMSNISDSLVGSVITGCDIWHYPTSSEVFCFSVLEAMSAKKPVISYKLDAVKEFFTDDQWLADSYDDMIEKTEKMINLNPQERQSIGESNYEVYLNHLPEIFAEKIMDHYDDVFKSNEQKGYGL